MILLYVQLNFHIYFFGSSFFSSGFGVGSLKVSGFLSVPGPTCCWVLALIIAQYNEILSYLPSRCSSLEIPERLGQLQGLNHNALLLLIVPNLCITSQREIFAQGMSIKAIVRHNTSQIWVTNEENAKEIVDLSFVPVRPVIQTGNAGDRRGLICIRLDPNARVIAHT
jgi:hypothetical protein